MIIEQAFNADRFCEFLHALIQDSDKKVFLIVDNLRVHHSKQVKAWVDERTQHIELFYLPSYSPQLNPEERLNRRSEAGDGQTGSRANNLRTTSGCQRLHDHVARSPRARHGLLPGSRPICRLKLHRAGSIVPNRPHGRRRFFW